MGIQRLHKAPNGGKQAWKRELGGASSRLETQPPLDADGLGSTALGKREPSRFIYTPGDGRQVEPIRAAGDVNDSGAPPGGRSGADTRGGRRCAPAVTCR